MTEQQFVLNKMLHTRLPEVLASHYNLATINSNTSNSTTQQTSREKKAEASELLQQVLSNIEERLDRLLEQMETQHLQELRVMKNYIDSHDS